MDTVDDANRWMSQVISTDIKKSLLLLNTEACGYSPTKKMTIHSNTEARLVCLVCKSLLQVSSEQN